MVFLTLSYHFILVAPVQQNAIHPCCYFVVAGVLVSLWTALHWTVFLILCLSFMYENDTYTDMSLYLESLIFVFTVLNFWLR